MNIKVMADYECPPLWHDGDGVGPIDPADLEISAKLAEDLWAWGADYDGTLNRDDPVNSGFASTAEEIRFEDTGRALTRRLARELQGTAKVRWWKDAIPTDFDLGVADRVLVVDGAGYDSKHRRENAVLAEVRDPGQLDRLRESVAVDEEGRFRRDFLAQFASSPDVPSDVRRARARAAEASASVFTHAVWRELGEDIAPEFESMIGPLSEDPSALGGPLLLLTKCLIDAIDPTPLKEFLKDAEPGERSLALLGRAAERLGGSSDDVEPLRALHDFRSSGGVAHLAGSKRDAALQRLGIRGMTTIEAFDHVAARLTHCLEQLTGLFENAAE